jgi:hypothetical protein
VLPPADYQYYEGSSGSRDGSNLEEFHLNLPYEEIKVMVETELDGSQKWKGGRD